MLLPVSQHPRDSWPQIEQLLDSPLRAAEGVSFQAFAHQRDEHDLGGHEVFAHHGRRNRGDRQRDVGSDPALEERGQSLVNDSAAANHRGE